MNIKALCGAMATGVILATAMSADGIGAKALLAAEQAALVDGFRSAKFGATGAQVNEAISHLAHGRTTFIIAHRFSSLRNADKIMVLEDGGITAQGTHHELMESSVLYRKLFDLQFDDDQSAGIVGRLPVPDPEGAS